MTLFELLKTKAVIFWDFDGVIKDSVSVKTDAFSLLFKPYGPVIQKKVIAYHLENGGVSRFDKIRHFYSQYLNKNISDTELYEICEEFSRLVLQEVINSPWVPGVKKFLLDNPYNQRFIIVTGTPQEEIELILEELKIKQVFSSVYGSPKSKVDIVKEELRNNLIEREKYILIGDSKTDYDAAISNDISFVLRKTEDNKRIQMKSDIYMISDFNSYKGELV